MLILKRRYKTWNILCLKKFDFNLTVISSYRFLQQFVRFEEENSTIFYLSQYMIELALVEYKMIKYKPSVLAGGALYLTHKIMGVKDPWPQKLEEYSSLNEKDVRP